MEGSKARKGRINFFAFIHHRHHIYYKLFVVENEIRFVSLSLL